ncbi:hypothetical protein [Herbiconiux ginsengi]|uniref:Uncharacterized protein n=1 Tax=Herbiconiux ginsengi TaxID=381665 RepID=A0A1H3Q5B5_9MICO|nr:hypothetical protein [Herbiconiux ginsengi]SDZ08205.1 hypothetical protein SAMN05216554_2305 [Herbiconiux ginsengi]
MSGAGRSRARTPDGGVLTQLVRARRIGPRAVDAVRQDIERDSRLGLGYLGIGAVIVGVMLLIRGLVSFAWTWTANDWRLLTVVAWLIVIGAFAVAVLMARRSRGVLAPWAFRSLLAVDAVALGLDYTALLLADDPANYVTIGIGVGATLLACVTFRPLGSILTSTIALTAISLAFLAWQSVTDPENAAFGFAQLVLTVMPAFAGIVIVRSFGQLVQRELDRTVIESTIDAPRFGLGLLASSELARLDLAAEELLQDVATGRVDLPLDRDLASTASSLATDLRRTLVAGRRETWLHHAITESEYLAPAVTLSDPGGLAGYLEPVQRDGLLSAIWLIVDESGRSNPTIDLSVDDQGVPSRSTADDRMGLPIVMSVGGIPRRRIDPAVWSALSRVGQYSVDARAGRLRVSVDAHVVVPDASR